MRVASVLIKRPALPRYVKDGRCTNLRSTYYYDYDIPITFTFLSATSLDVEVGPRTAQSTAIGGGSIARA